MQGICMQGVALGALDLWLCHTVVVTHLFKSWNLQLAPDLLLSVSIYLVARSLMCDPPYVSMLQGIFFYFLTDWVSPVADNVPALLSGCLVSAAYLFFFLWDWLFHFVAINGTREGTNNKKHPPKLTDLFICGLTWGVHIHSNQTLQGVYTAPSPSFCSFLKGLMLFMHMGLSRFLISPKTW